MAKSSDTQWHVAKTLRPGDPGTLKLLRRYGHALVCVRYRENSQGDTRRVTVELALEDNPIQQRMIWTTIPKDRADLRAAAMKQGAVWNSQEKRWQMTVRLAKALGLVTSCSIAKLPTHDTQR
jgi:hypothetical protein